MATFFSLPYDLFIFSLIATLVISKFGFKAGTLVLIASVPGHCLTSNYFFKKIWSAAISNKLVFSHDQTLLK